MSRRSHNMHVSVSALVICFYCYPAISGASSAIAQNEVSIAGVKSLKQGKNAPLDTDKVFDVFRTTAEGSRIEGDLVGLGDKELLSSAMGEAAETQRPFIRAALFQLTTGISPRTVVYEYLVKKFNSAEQAVSIDENIRCVQSDAVAQLFPGDIVYAAAFDDYNFWAGNSANGLFIINSEGKPTFLNTNGQLKQALSGVRKVFSDNHLKEMVVSGIADLAQHVGAASSYLFKAPKIEFDDSKVTFTATSPVVPTLDTTGFIATTVAFDGNNRISNLEIAPRLDRGWLGSLASSLPLPLGKLHVPLLVLAVALSLALIWVVSLGFFLDFTKKIDQDLSKALKALKQITEDEGCVNMSSFGAYVITPIGHERLGEEFEKIGSLKNHWLEFRESTIPDIDAAKTVYNTHRAKVFFSEQDIVEHGLRAAYYFQSFPGLCTGIGLFGTFSAIFLGLNCLGVNPLTGQVRGIEAFINQLSGKFLSSIVGLLCAVTFLAYERYMLGQLVNKCLSVQHGLDNLYPQCVPEKFLEKIAISIREQTSALRHFDTSMSNYLKDSFQESLQPVMEKLLDGITRLHDATETLKQEKQASAAEVIEKVIMQLSRNMQESMDAFRVSLTEGANNDIAKLAETLSKTADVMDKKNEQISSLLDHTDSRLREQQNVSQESFEKLSEQFHSLTDVLSAAIGQQKEAGAEQLSAMQKSIQELLGNVDRTTSEQTQRTGAFISQVMEQTDAKFAELEARSAQTNQAISESVGSMSSTILGQTSAMLVEQDARSEAATVRLNEALQVMVKSVLSQTTAAFEQQEARSEAATTRLTETLQTTVAAVMHELDEGISKQQQLLLQAQSTLQQTVEQSIQTVGDISRQHIERTQAFLNDLMEKVRDWLSIVQKDVSNSSETIMATLKTLTSAYLKDTREALLSSVQAVQTANAVTIEHLREVGQNNAENAKAITAAQHAFSELEKVITAAADACNQQMNGVAALGKEMQGSAGELGKSVSQLVSAQATVQQASGKVQEQLSSGSALVEQFKTILHQQERANSVMQGSIGDVLKSIEESLGQYSSHTRTSLGNYLGDFDKTLAEATNKLGTTVGELDERLSELTEVMEKTLAGAGRVN